MNDRPSTRSRAIPAGESHLEPAVRSVEQPHMSSVDSHAGQVFGPPQTTTISRTRNRFRACLAPRFKSGLLPERIAASGSKRLDQTSNQLCWMYLLPSIWL